MKASDRRDPHLRDGMPRMPAELTEKERAQAMTEKGDDIARLIYEYASAWSHLHITGEGDDEAWAARSALDERIAHMERKAAALDKLEAYLVRRSTQEVGAYLSHYRYEDSEWFFVNGYTKSSLLDAIEAIPEEKENGF